MSNFDEMTCNFISPNNAHFDKNDDLNVQVHDSVKIVLLNRIAAIPKNLHNAKIQ